MPESETDIVVLLFNGCVGEYCEGCHGAFCTPLSPEVFSALLMDTRVTILWNTQSGRGLAEAVRQAREEHNVDRPLTGYYTIGMSSRMDGRPALPAQAAEDWYMHCEREEAGCTGQVSSECRCHLLFDLSEFTGISFDMENVFVPNTGSVSVEEPLDLDYGQNWYASVLGERLQNEPYDILSLDMYAGMWPVFSVYSGDLAYLAQPVEHDYGGRVGNLQASIEVLRHHLPEGTMVATNGGQIDMALGRFLPSLEEGRPLPQEIEEMIQSGVIDPAAMLAYLFGGELGAAHPEWWDAVGANVDAIGADGWVIFPTLLEGGGFASLFWMDQVWRDVMDYAIKGVESGKGVGLASDGGDAMDSSEDLRARYYSIGSFLLIQNRETDTAYTYISIGYLPQLMFTPDFVFCVALPAEVDIPLGSPTHSASGTIDSLEVVGSWEGLTLSGPVYARRFQNGVVLVNPSAEDPVDITLPSTLRHRVSFRGFGYLSTDATVREFTGHDRIICTTPVETATLPPGSSLVFLGTPVAEESCPEPW